MPDPEETERELARIRSKWEHDGYHPWKDDAFKALEIADELFAARRLLIAEVERLRLSESEIRREALKDAVARVQGEEAPNNHGTIAVSYAVELILDGLGDDQ